MIFIIGGACQGKTEYAKEYIRSHQGGDMILADCYHLKVKEQLLAGLDPLNEAEKLLAESSALVIVSNEIGCGLVPVDAFEREYREQSGRVNCYFAARAEQVIRVVCGVGMRIK